jgi:putative endopeptidase
MQSKLLRSAVTALLAFPLVGLAATPASVPPRSGLDLSGFDWTVRPADDLNAFTNGHWLKQTVIPEDRASVGTFDALEQRSEQQLHALMDQILAGPAADPDSARIAALYASFMDEATIAQRGLKPLSEPLQRIQQAHSTADLVRLFAALGNENVMTPIAATVHADQKQPEAYTLDLSQSGLGLPDRDYYLSDDETLVKMRGQYKSHVERMLQRAGLPHAAEAAADVLSIETQIAKIQWSRVENRDPVKTYNKMTGSYLQQLAPGLDWQAYFMALGIAVPSTVTVSQPSYLEGLSRVFADQPLSAWKNYLRWHLLSAYAPYLPKAFDQEHFAFYGTVLEGTPAQKERWRRGIALVDKSVGEALGRLYVEAYFPPDSRSKVERLVRNLIATYAEDIDTLDWMGPATKQAAHAKLDALMLKIGYPDHWRDYGALHLDRHDLVGNVRRAALFESQRNLAKLGLTVDRTEWDMTPPTINAYYNPAYNEIVFPAAILQPPFFDPTADDAVNYGAVGAVIGHEISHGFDDEGSQFDAKGNLTNWWTEADRAAFTAKAERLVAEYSTFEPVPGFHINGQLTLGENIADNSGLTIAYKAYQRSLAGQTAPIIDGFTGPQRFYLGFAQVWREKARDNVTIELIKSDPHSMPSYRVIGTVRNQPGYFEAFDVKPGDAAYVAPSDRVQMW